MKHSGIPGSVQSEMRRLKLDWSIEHRRNHDAIMVNGKVVTYVSRTIASCHRNEKNLLAQIRRFARGIELSKYRKS